MEHIQLNKEAIVANIAAIEALDLKTASVKEIEELLFPFFRGLRVKAPSLNPGVYLYRSRVCSAKPEHVRELSYPPKEYVRSYGRANDMGQSMFYGGISKNIPFFEIGAKLGDNITMSVWRTKSNLVLNHIGFTEEIFKLLGSNREWDAIYPFVKDTNNFSDLNAFVYNYLAAEFSKQVPKHEPYLYKPSIAIANKLLMGEVLQGILYPAMAMAGNADNLVLKPSYVDTHMEFVAVEYLEVTYAEGMQYRYEALDSATEILDGRIRWSGKGLAWTLRGNQSIAMTAEGGDWIGRDDQGQRLDPKSIQALNNTATALEKKFLNDFEHAVKVSKDVPLKSPAEIINAKCILLLDFDQTQRYLSFYIPPCENPLEAAQTLVSAYSSFLYIDHEQILEVKDEKTGKLLYTNKDLKSSNKIYLYSESSFEPNLLQKPKGLEVHSQFPG